MTAFGTTTCPGLGSGISVAWRPRSAPRKQTSAPVRHQNRSTTPCGLPVRFLLSVYIAIPADVADMPVLSPEAPLHFNRYGDHNNLSTLFDFAVDACHLLASATSSGVLLGHLAARHGVTCEVEELVGAP